MPFLSSLIQLIIHLMQIIQMCNVTERIIDHHSPLIYVSHHQTLFHIAQLDLYEHEKQVHLNIPTTISNFT